MSLRFEQRSQSASQQPATAAETTGSARHPLPRLAPASHRHVLIGSPVAENVDDRLARREAERPVVLATIARRDDGGVFLGDNKLRVPTEEPPRLPCRRLQGSRHILAVVFPCLGELRGSSKIGEARETSHVLRVDLEALSQPTTDVRRRSRDEILDRDHGPRSRLLVQHACPRQRRSERSEQINAKGAFLVDYLKQRLALGRVWMNVIQQKPIGERSGDCVEAVNNEVHIVQTAPVNGATTRVQMRFYSETTCEDATTKALRQKLFDNARGSFGVDGHQEG